MGKTMFQSYWRNYCNWVQCSPKSVHCAVCLYCNAEISISADIMQLLKHEATLKHNNMIEEAKTVDFESK